MRQRPGNGDSCFFLAIGHLHDAPPCCRCHASVQHGEPGAHGSHPRSLNALRGSRPAFFSFSHSLTNLLFFQRRLVPAAHLLTTSSYSPTSIISRATSAPSIA